MIHQNNMSILLYQYINTFVKQYSVIIQTNKETP